MLKIIWQLLLVPVFVSIWFFSLGAVGIDVAFKNGSAVRLRGWWRE